MKRCLVILAVASATAFPAAAQLYKYVDKNGKTVYSDQPPPNVESKQLNISTGRSTTAATPAAGKGAVERDKELQKSRDEAKEKQKKADESAQKAQEAEKRCAQARQSYQTFADGGRIHKYNDKGERELLTDSEIDAGRERARREMDEACKAAR